MDKVRIPSFGFKEALNESSLDEAIARQVFERHSVTSDGTAPIILHSTWLELCMLSGIQLPGGNFEGSIMNFSFNQYNLTAHVIEAVGVKNRDATSSGLLFDQFLRALTEACSITGRISIKQALNTVASGSNGALPSPRATRLPSALKSKANNGWSSPRSDNRESSSHSGSSFELPKINEGLGLDSRTMSRARLGTASSSLFVKESKQHEGGKDENVMVFEKIVGRLESLLQARHQQDENAAGSRALLDLIKSMAQRVDVLEASEKTARTIEQTRTKQVDSELSELSKAQDLSKISIEQCGSMISTLESQMTRSQADFKLFLDQKINENRLITEQYKASVDSAQSYAASEVVELRHKLKDLEGERSELQDQVLSSKEDQATMMSMMAQQASTIAGMEKQIESLVSVFQSFQSSSNASLEAKDKEIEGLRNSCQSNEEMLVTLREEYTRMFDENTTAATERFEQKEAEIENLIQEMDTRLTSALSEASRANAGLDTVKMSIDPLAHRVSALESKLDALSSVDTNLPANTLQSVQPQPKPQTESSMPPPLPPPPSFSVNLEPLESSIRQLQADLFEQRKIVSDFVSTASSSPLPPMASSNIKQASSISDKDLSDLKAHIVDEMKVLSEKASTTEESISSYIQSFDSKFAELEKKMQEWSIQNDSASLVSEKTKQEALFALNERMKGFEEKLSLAQVQSSQAPPSASDSMQSDETAGKLAAFEYKIASTLQQMHQLTTQKLTELSTRMAEIEKKSLKQYQSLDRASPSKI